MRIKYYLIFTNKKSSVFTPWSIDLSKNSHLHSLCSHFSSRNTNECNNETEKKPSLWANPQKPTKYNEPWKKLIQQLKICIFVTSTLYHYRKKKLKYKKKPKEAKRREEKSSDTLRRVPTLNSEGINTFSRSLRTRKLFSAIPILIV